MSDEHSNPVPGADENRNPNRPSMEEVLRGMNRSGNLSERDADVDDDLEDVGTATMPQNDAPTPKRTDTDATATTATQPKPKSSKNGPAGVDARKGPAPQPSGGAKTTIRSDGSVVEKDKDFIIRNKRNPVAEAAAKPSLKQRRRDMKRRMKKWMATGNNKRWLKICVVAGLVAGPAGLVVALALANREKIAKVAGPKLGALKDKIVDYFNPPTIEQWRKDRAQPAPAGPTPTTSKKLKNG